MNEPRSKSSVRLAAGAACAFTLAALAVGIPLLLERQRVWASASAITLATAAILWWAIFFRWKREIER